MFELLKEFIKPELLVLVPVLYLAGMALKRSNVRDCRIPGILGAAGVVLCGLYILGTGGIANWQNVVMGVFTAVVQGVLIAGASVYVNQMVKQAGKEE